MQNDNLSKTGAFISELRKEKQFTQKDLADRLGVTDKAVSKWERGLSYPDVSLLTELAQILGVSTNELLSGEASESSIIGTAPENETAAHTSEKEEREKINLKGLLWKKVFTISALTLLSMLVYAGANAAVEGSLGWAIPPLGLTLFIALIAMLGAFITKKYKIGSVILCGTIIYLITFYYAALNMHPDNSIAAAGDFPKVYLPHYTVVIAVLILSILIFIAFFSNRKKVHTDDFNFLLGGLSITFVIIAFLTISAIVDYVDLNGFGVDARFTILILITVVINFVFFAILAASSKKRTVASK